LVAMIALFLTLPITVPVAGHAQNQRYHHYQLVDVGTFGGLRA
jgi:hypothetical protein